MPVCVYVHSYCDVTGSEYQHSDLLASDTVQLAHRSIPKVGTVPDLPQQAASYLGMPFVKTKIRILNENNLLYDCGKGEGNRKKLLTVDC